MNKSEQIKKLKYNSGKAASFLKAIAHKERLLILCQLTKKELYVGELLKPSKLSQSAFSQHLAVLRNSRLVKIRKESQKVFYSLADKNVHKVIQALQESFCKKNN
jgi:ArsR family transcriptional regulator, virulence genes transcriptional regulator